jgi:hypothetical protein
VWPFGAVTVPVKVVSAETAPELAEPDATGVTEPTPWSIENVSPFVVVQLSVV